jgi:hypothetical protein
MVKECHNLTVKRIKVGGTRIERDLTHCVHIQELVEDLCPDFREFQSAVLLRLSRHPLSV